MADTPVPSVMARQLAEQTARLSDALLELGNVTREAQRRVIQRYHLEGPAASVTPPDADRRSLTRSNVLVFGRATDRASRG